jgi:thioredoxin 2
MPTMLVRCPSCRTLNRAAPERAGQAGRCGECGSSFTVPYPQAPRDLTDASFDHEVGNSPLPVLVEFWAPTCGHCVRMEPVIRELAVELTGRAVVMKLDVSANGGTAARYDIRGTPAFVLMEGGRERARFFGAMPKDELMRRLSAYI